MIKKYRQYSRDIKTKELDDLRKKYQKHLKSSKGGFLSAGQRKRLLGFKKREMGTSDSDFWWRIKNSVKDSLIDMRLICDIASEEELKEIFGSKSMATEDYPLVKFFLSFLPQSYLRRDKGYVIEIEEEKQWRKAVLDELIVDSLDWYVNSGLIKTDLQLRLIIDTMDTITVVSTGEKGIMRKTVDAYDKIAW